MILTWWRFKGILNGTAKKMGDISIARVVSGKTHSLLQLFKDLEIKETRKTVIKGYTFLTSVYAA